MDEDDRIEALAMAAAHAKPSDWRTFTEPSKR